ncbi:MAG TPA: aldo/keto reductase [Candidatus Hydrogenedentes bacterium]|nr:aldo/keto reductase [Candidatus Hydrogenedentota bacterium]
MQKRMLGESGIEASVVGLGTWVTGGGEMWNGADDAESERAIHAALDHGITLIDTAPAYGWGRSEEIVGRAIRGRRDQVVLATKCGMWWEDQRGSFHFAFDGHETYISLRPDTLAVEIENSLRRLGTDHIDLYQPHWPSKEPDLTPIEDTMAFLLKLKDEGKIRAIGVSNVSVEQLARHRACGPVASDQFRYSLLFRAPEADILPYCAENTVGTLTYMSLEQGLLTGKVGMDRVFDPNEFRNNEAWNPWFKLSNRPKVLAMLDGWKGLTEKYACSLAQLVIAWTAAQRGVSHVLCGARTEAQAVQNAAAGALTLDPADVARIRADAAALGDPE